MTPKVSVIVCTYNQEDTIGAALDSILAQQTDFDFEVVVADDCSADRTPAICREYAERYPGKVRAILNDENKGIADNYYDTLYECRGKYIADLAGDDLWTDPNKLARQAALMDSDPSIVLCHGAWQYLHPDGSMSFSEDHAVPDQDYVVDGAKMLPYLLQHRKDEVFIHLCTSMYRRDTAIALTQKYSDFFYGRNLTCEDFQLEVLMAASGRIAYDCTPVLAYRTGHDSLSSMENPAKAAIFASKVAAMTKKLAEELTFDPTLLKDFYTRQMLFAISKAFISGRNDAARQAMADSAFVSPQLPRRARFALAAMKFKPLWAVCRMAYKLFQR
ncbi:MAG: glycosyltransferase family 2 protein [Muribaculaceae bacterium]|nr:glycosyltransferase family 2 protein [Muribaculaceae bacterium]